jgi:hypothetical protein
MKIASFDVGIRNMAYCIFDVSGSNISITDWNVVNLLPKNDIIRPCTADVIRKGNKKKNLPEITRHCGNKSKYTKNDLCFCERHAKTSCFILPLKKYSQPVLKKNKLDYAKSVCSEFHIIPTGIKSNIIEQLKCHFNTHMLEPLNKPRENAKSIDLITIGRNIKTEFDKLPSFTDVTNVIIENQISPIANRMKSVQGMLAQYFIMKNDNISIEFVSSSGKLKGFSQANTNLDSEYKQHKTDAVFHTKRLLSNELFSSWREHILTHKKIDDLADAFLQGIWYLKTHNICIVA